MEASPVALLSDAFRAHYGHAPVWFASAPGRVNLIGEFTDYNEGFVLPMALDCRTRIVAAPNASQQIRIYSEQGRESLSLNTRAVPVRDSNGAWGNYLKGVLAGFLE